MPLEYAMFDDELYWLLINKLNNGLNPEECDATGDAMKNKNRDNKYFIK
jgi:hypothetical protein